MSERLSYLFERYLAVACTPEEKQELMGLALEPGMQDELSVLIRDAWHLTGEENDLPEEKALAMMEKIFPSYREAVVRPDFTAGRGWWKWVAAASLLIAVLGAYFYFSHRWMRVESVVKNTSPAHDVAAPVTTKARISLASGRVIRLDSAGSGTLAVQGGVKIRKDDDGEVVYSVENNEGGEVQYNTLDNPRGSKVASLVLSDGTKVWLNSESSLRYFASVGRGGRHVTVDGEAYFEVAADATRPFIVSANGVTTEVLGTRFNVNCYPEEKHIAITLLEGGIRVSRGGIARVLQPGQQAQTGEGISVKNNIDVGAVMAWKNGLFQFVNADLPVVLRQLARWYDLEVVYEGAIPVRKFEGKIQRNLHLSDVLDALARNQVHYSIVGNKLTVKPSTGK